MRKKHNELLVVILLVLIYPAMLASLIIRYDAPMGIQEALQESGSRETDAMTAVCINVVTADDGICEMLLDDYLTGVLLAEMPLSFDSEALKAQAVVARTYTLRRRLLGGKHVGASVCVDSNCCQGYMTPESFYASGGSDALFAKAQKAVEDTAGRVLVYNDQLIDATYFSCSGGMTEDAVAVWGADIPYLQAQPSPGEEDAQHYMDTITYSKEEFFRLLQIENTATSNQISNIVYTAGGGVDTIEICGKEFKGTQMRQLLGLRSTAFVISIVAGRVTITTKGFGHRVGMSQYGADAMARQGKTYEEILLYYYQGTEIKVDTGD